MQSISLIIISYWFYVQAICFRQSGLNILTLTLLSSFYAWLLVSMCVHVYTYMLYIAGLCIPDVCNSFWEAKTLTGAASKGKLKEKQEAAECRQWTSRQKKECVQESGDKYTHGKNSAQEGQGWEMLLRPSQFLYEYVGMDVCMRSCVFRPGTHAEVRGQCVGTESLLPSCGSWRLSSGVVAMPSPAKLLTAPAARFDAEKLHKQTCIYFRKGIGPCVWAWLNPCGLAGS